MTKFSKQENARFPQSEQDGNNWCLLFCLPISVHLSDWFKH